MSQIIFNYDSNSCVLNRLFLPKRETKFNVPKVDGIQLRNAEFHYYLGCQENYEKLEQYIVQNCRNNYICSVLEIEKLVVDEVHIDKGIWATQIIAVEACKKSSSNVRGQKILIIII